MNDPVELGEERPAPPPPGGRLLEQLRQICLGLPETTERLSHGEPTWFVRDKKTFVMYANHHHDDRVAFWCAAPAGLQEALVEAYPDRYFRPPYVGHRGWLGVWLDVPVDWEEIAGLVMDAYRMVAPKRLVAEMDAGLPLGAPLLARAPEGLNPRVPSIGDIDVAG